jgi:hypothetical protein
VSPASAVKNKELPDKELPLFGGGFLLRYCLNMKKNSNFDVFSFVFIISFLGALLLGAVLIKSLS